MLATDLDGTFLGGRQADRLSLYRALRASPDLCLVFVTGRGAESVLPLLSDPLVPDPDYIIADVGATVLHGDGRHPVTPLQWELSTRWVGMDPILEALRDMPTLVRQRVPQERRCSYLLEDAELLDEVRARVAHLEVDVLYSADRYLDVLPRGISKGDTLRRLAEHLGVPDAEVVVAGDTLNDLSLFDTGYRGVVVGQAEPALLAATAGRPQVHHATAPGAGGILEVLRNHIGFGTPAPEPPTGDAQLVVVYHRLPYEERRVQGTVVRRRHTSPNGIVPTLLGCFDRGRQGSWVAWTTHHDGSGVTTHDLVDEARYPNLVAAKVPLADADVERFYKKFSKEAFWPVIFSFVERARFVEEDWQHFLEINRRFAAAAAAEADTGALVWIHDYNLWMVPGELRRLRPDLRIGFFHHTSFPPADVFNVIPWAGQIMGSLSQCDYVGFHIPRYAANFLDVLRSHAPTEVLETVECAPRFRVHGGALAIPRMPSRVRTNAREIRLGAHPVGVNTRAIRAILDDPVRQAQVQAVRHRFREVQLVLSVERLDYVKGPLQKLEAFESLLAVHPSLHGTVSLLMVTTPPAPGMEVYEEVREAVDQVVGRINGRFGTLAWTPVHYLFRSLPFEDVIVYSAAADVAWITPLRDGLNLVAKEFVMAKHCVDGAGVLLLSEFAGAAVELHGALLTNPYDVDGMTRHLREALQKPEEARVLHIKRLAAIVERNDVDAWSREFLDAMAGAHAGA
jgi:glucosylglycerol-phosphate synthase